MRAQPQPERMRRRDVLRRRGGTIPAAARHRRSRKRSAAVRGGGARNDARASRAHLEFVRDGGPMHLIE